MTSSKRLHIKKWYYQPDREEVAMHFAINAARDAEATRNRPCIVGVFFFDPWYVDRICEICEHGQRVQLRAHLNSIIPSKVDYVLGIGSHYRSTPVLLYRYLSHLLFLLF
jgi:hypothetical protein